MQDIILHNLVNAYLNRAASYRYALEANYLNPFTPVYVQLNSGSGCYSYQEHSSRVESTYSIVLGSKFYSTLRGVDKDYPIPIDKQSIIFSDIALLYDAVFFHEIGHVLYTPMTLAREVSDLLDSQRARNFLHLFHLITNLVEDVVIEGEILLYRPQTLKAIMHLRRLAFSTVPVDIKTDLTGVINVLLYNFRTTNVNKINYPDAATHKFITTYMYVCINTHDPVLRLQRCLAFAAALWDVFNCKESISYANYKSGLGSVFYKNIPDKYKDKPEDDNPEQQGEDVSPSDMFNSARSYSSNNEPEETSSSTSTKGESVDNPAKDVEVERCQSFSDGDIPKLPPNSELDEREILASAHEEVQCDYSRHIFMEVKKHYDSSMLMNRYLDVVNKYSIMIAQIADIIKKRKNWNNTHWEEYRTSGKLNDKAFYKNTYKIYKQRSLPKREADLAFSILIDNSGSMYGIKTRICGEALIVLSEVFNKLNIPFEVNAFTECRQAITLGLKSFKDDYNKVKTNLSLIEQQVQVTKLSMFGSNIDEINLDFIWRGFRKRPEKDKIIIVISDGETCGSEQALKNLAKEIERDGIQVLGLGIRSSCVDRLYSQHKTFYTEEDLKGLPKFLNDYLISKIFKKEEI